jgi:uncharacterized membrane protein
MLRGKRRKRYTIKSRQARAVAQKSDRLLEQAYNTLGRLADTMDNEKLDNALYAVSAAQAAVTTFTRSLR